MQLIQFILLFPLDILKSVYELRKSHAALASRPSSSNPFNQTRRNIQSAVPRKQQQMAFGGFLIPSSTHRTDLVGLGGANESSAEKQFNI